MEGDAKTTFVSSEMFEPLSLKAIQKIPAYFPADQKFTILAVMRSPVDLLPSIYSQRTKTGTNRLDFDQYFDQVLSTERISIYETLEAWAQVFGWDALRVRYLDRTHLHQGDLISDVLQLLLPQADPARLAALERVSTQNTSPGWKLVEMLRDNFNRLLPEREKGEYSKEERAERLLLKESLNRQVMLEIDQKMGGMSERGLYMTRPQAELSLARYKEDVARINPKLVWDQIPTPLELDESGFKERIFLPDASHVSAEQREQFAGLLAQYVQAGRERAEERKAVLQRRQEKAQKREKKRELVLQRRQEKPQKREKKRAAGKPGKGKAVANANA